MCQLRGVVSGLVLAGALLLPGVAHAQVSDGTFFVHGSAGPTLIDAGAHISGAVGFAPTSQITVLATVERTQLFSRRSGNERGSSAFRGGTLLAVSGEARVTLWRGQRVHPYGLAGFGVGVSRPTVDFEFTDRVTNGVRFGFAGGGVHVQVRERLGIFADVRVVLGEERNELLAFAPIRAGVTWAF